MSGSIHLNATGKSHLDSLVAAGKDSTAPWNAPTGGDASWYLAVDSSEPATAEAHYKYPFTSDGKTVNRKALASIESYATTNNQPDIASAAHEALQKLDKKSMAEGDQNATLQNVEIFSVGKWRGSRTVEATPAMLDQIVANFHQLNAKVSGYGVPVKLGHNNTIGEPAYGWMSDLARVGDVLVADFSHMDPAIVDAIGKRRYNSVSVELYPVVSYAGKTFDNVLGAVALLGAEWPAVKGLKPLSASLFAGAGEKLELSKEENDVTTFTEDQHNTLLTAAVDKAKADAKAEVATELKAATDAKTAADERATRAETALAALSDDAEKNEIAAIIKAAEDKGQIVPANKASVEKFAESLRKSVAKGDERKALIATFKDFVGALPAKVKFGEQGASKSKDDAASGQKVADQIDEKAKALMSADAKLTYEMAVQRVYRESPDLKTAYAQEM